MSGETVKLLRSDAPFPPWIDHGFTTRVGGVSTGPFETLNLAWRTGDDPANVVENHRRAAASLGYDSEGLAAVRQVHGARVVVVRSAAQARAAREEKADGIVLAPDRVPAALAAAVRVADCCPVLLAAIDRPAAAALHCGWRSLVGGVVEAGVAALREAAGASPERLAAAIGPCIGPEAFEVGEEVAAAFAREAGAGVVVRRGGGVRPRVDLAAAARSLLVRAGVSPEAIRLVRRCTFSEPAVFFSHRRDGAPSGRQAGVIVLKPGGPPT